MPLSGIIGRIRLGFNGIYIIHRSWDDNGLYKFSLGRNGILMTEGDQMGYFQLSIWLQRHNGINGR